MYDDALYDSFEKDFTDDQRVGVATRIRDRIESAAEWWQENKPRLRKYTALHRSKVVDRAVTWMRLEKLAKYAFIAISVLILGYVALVFVGDASRETLVRIFPAFGPQAGALFLVYQARRRSHIPRRRVWVPNMKRPMLPPADAPAQQEEEEPWLKAAT